MDPRFQQMVDDCLADVFEKLYPEETLPRPLLMKLLAHCPHADETWDAEDLTYYARSMFTWLTGANFCKETHPRLYAVASHARFYVFCISLVSKENGLGTTMTYHLQTHTQAKFM